MMTSISRGPSRLLSYFNKVQRYQGFMIVRIVLKLYNSVVSKIERLYSQLESFLINY